MTRDLQALKRIIGAGSFRKFQIYSASVEQTAGTPVQGDEKLVAVVRYALREWMDTTGAGHIQDAIGLESAELLNSLWLSLEGAAQSETKLETFSGEDVFRARGMGIKLD